MPVSYPSACRVLLLLLLGLAAPATWSQTVFRCGNSYSQAPCPEGRPISVDDSRTTDQKAQTDAATAQAGKLADRMEKERLAREKSLAPAGAAQSAKSPHTPGKPAAAATGKAAVKPKKAEPEFFTAAAAPPPKVSKKK